MEVKKSYSVKELAGILGCSVTAVQKKITQDENNPDLRRYKKRFDVVTKDGKTVILLSDSELEEEKRLSKGFNNVTTNNYTTHETVIDVEAEPEIQVKQDASIDKLLEFTKGYIESYKTLQETYYKELKEKDEKILLLTTNEYKNDAESKQVKAKSEELEKRNRLLTLYLTVVSTLLLTFIVVYITLQVRL